MNCIIVDDEPLAREGMMLLVGQHAELNLVGCFSGSKTAAEFLDLNFVDLIFLDIQMSGVNGIEFAATIKPSTLIIFTTAYEKYAFKSYEINPIDYLLKPILEDRFGKAVQKAHNYHLLLKHDALRNSVENVTDNFLIIRADKKFHKIAFDEILYLEALKDYVVIQTTDSKIIAAMNLRTLFLKLPQDYFFRVSKSYVVNKAFIKVFDNHTIYINSAEIPIGDAYRKDFLDKFLGSGSI